MEVICCSAILKRWLNGVDPVGFASLALDAAERYAETRHVSVGPAGTSEETLGLAILRVDSKGARVYCLES